MVQDRLSSNKEFKQWLVSLKTRIRQSQIKAAIRINEELLYLYWDLGHDIVVRQMDAVWGGGFFDRLSKELRAEFPEMQGFSKTNLKYCKYFYQFYTQDNTIFQQLSEKLGILENPIRPQLVDELHQQFVDELQIIKTHGITIRPQVVDELQGCEKQNMTIRQQVVDELQIVEMQDITIRQQVVDEFKTYPIFQIPWGHHIQIINKCKSVSEAVFYVHKTIENGWSRALLMNFMDTGLFLRQGKSLNNFDRLLPKAHSDLAKEILKCPYNFDFVVLTENYKERELENALSENLTKMLLELGKGFAFVGRQVPVQVGGKELFMDMLFYHLKLRCYVVIELKTGEFDGAFTGQLGVYVAAVNHQMLGEYDNPTLGLLICKTKDNVMAQYSLESSSLPIGISEYELTHLLPENLQSSLPSIAEIEEKLKEI